MKLTNVDIEIKVGKKQYHLKNLILDVLLNKYAEILDPSNYKNGSRYLSHCLFKFDTPLAFDETTEITNSSFDITVGNLGFGNGIELSPTKVVTKSTYNDAMLNTFSPYNIERNWEYYVGRKICTIGFNSTFINSTSQYVKAIIDVSNYNIIVEEGSEVIVTRIDTCTTDTKFYSSDEDIVKGNVHLSPLGMETIIEEFPLISIDGTMSQTYKRRAYAKMSELGFGYQESDLLYPIAEQVADLTGEVGKIQIGTLTTPGYPLDFYSGTEITITPSENTGANITSFECASTQVQTTTGTNKAETITSSVYTGVFPASTTFGTNTVTFDQTAGGGAGVTSRKFNVPINTVLTISADLKSTVVGAGTAIQVYKADGTTVLTTETKTLTTSYARYSNATFNTGAETQLIIKFARTTATGLTSVTNIMLATGTTTYEAYIPTSPSLDYLSPIINSGDVDILTNVISNGNFSNDLTNWSLVTAVATTTIDTTFYNSPSKSIKFAMVSTGYALYKQVFPSNLISGHKYYLRGFTRNTNANLTTLALRIRNSSDVILNQLDFEKTTLNTWKSASAIFTSIGTENHLALATSFPSAQSGDVYFDDIQLIDLTAKYGVGNEPTQAWCDSNITYDSKITYGVINTWVHKKNMFNKTKGTVGSYLKTDGTLGSSVDFQISDYIKVNISSNYTLSGAGNILSRLATGAVLYDMNKTFISYIGASTSNLTVTTTSTTAYVRFNVLIASINTTQFELSSATPYEPYTGAEYPITLPVGYVGGSLPNGVKDTDIAKNIGKVVLNGAEVGWTYFSALNTTNYNCFYIAISNMGGIISGIIKTLYCDKFNDVTWTNRLVDSLGCWQNKNSTNQFYIHVPNTITTTAQLQTWLASNNVTVQYQLATPIDISADITLPQIQTYTDYTVVDTTNAVKPTLSLFNTSLNPVNNLYPSDTLYPSDNLYPIMSQLNDYIIRYKVYQDVTIGTYESNSTIEVDTNYYYQQAFPLTENGTKIIKATYERGT